MSSTLFLAEMLEGSVEGSEGARTSFWAEVVSCLVVEEGRVVEGLGVGWEAVVGWSSILLEEEEGRYLSVAVVGDMVDSMSADVGRLAASFLTVVVDLGWDTSSTCSGGSGGG